MNDHVYFMESDQETLRLDVKTDAQAVERQALWAGIKPGMRVADLGCGSGKTSFCLHPLVDPGGEVIAVDIAEARIRYAREHYPKSGVVFVRRDIRKPLDDLGQFDFIWVRFVLEYYRKESFDIVRNISRILKPGGVLCLLDLDHNCLNHFGASARLESAFGGIMEALEKDANFDPRAGIKLYSFLYDLGYRDIEVRMWAHHLIFGPLGEREVFNWNQKARMVSKLSGYRFPEYEGRSEAFLEEFNAFLLDNRRFIYTPLISCRGKKKPP